MSATFRTRAVQANQVVYDQVDLFLVNQYTRATGVQVTDVTLAVFLNNAVVAWPLVDGTSVTDPQVVAGLVYWGVLPNGSYGIRFFPNSLGHWNLTFTYPGSTQIVGIDFDVVAPSSVESGVFAGFCT
jgi:hypothetical protein